MARSPLRPTYLTGHFFQPCCGVQLQLYPAKLPNSVPFWIHAAPPVLSTFHPGSPGITGTRVWDHFIKTLGCCPRKKGQVDSSPPCSSSKEASQGACKPMCLCQRPCPLIQHRQKDPTQTRQAGTQWERKGRLVVIPVSSCLLVCDSLPSCLPAASGLSLCFSLDCSSLTQHTRSYLSRAGALRDEWKWDRKE